ncbi:BaiN/RdsA family NAD(P)/FAD-dependent oxidoreductase [Apibacter adventoris]|uniref:Aminoacetone oxidase family FAD-binding enzyme n=1 Tax=Apibacter adventoris TaxID=1679466 RepID=A0A2S8AF30_9FLAO|nr:NAD(P)/FAD-dependent oxidoreductase [Apibacter adventoris]PQL94217.1 aminoacetone oxidase family FAD-binding enzyme [Apibacter adventoris]
MKQLIIIGGGAAGFFLASNLKYCNWNVLIIEQAKKPLQKLKISGGGRCNLSNACFVPKELTKFYPRGAKELLNVFHQFQPLDTIEWFKNKNTNIKIESDNRIFPETNSSQTIIDTLLNETSSNQINITYETQVTQITKNENKFNIQTNQNLYCADSVVICTGSSQKMWKIIEKLGHKIIPPVPSLFTFNCKNSLIQNLQGISFLNAEVSIPQLKIKENGPILITHWGLSGPAILRLSAWGAREIANLNYNFSININWISEKFDTVKENLYKIKQAHPKKTISSLKIYNITQRFWLNLLDHVGISNKLLADLGKKDINRIAEIITHTQLIIDGKSTYKNEFVTAGGVDLKEIDFKTMQSKLISGLYFAGEVLNIDAVTGGFNFQACWSEAFIISKQFKYKK